MLTMSSICVRAKFTLTLMVCEALATGRTAFSYPRSSLLRRRASSPNGRSVPRFLAESEEDEEEEEEEDEKEPPDEEVLARAPVAPALPRLAPSATEGTASVQDTTATVSARTAREGQTRRHDVYNGL